MMFSQTGPQRFVADNDAYRYLPTYFKESGIKKVLLLHGQKGWAVAKPYLPDFDGVEVVDVDFHGQCSYEEIDRVKAIATEKHVDMVIGVGGGKCLDTVKTVTTGTNMKLGLIPTLASNCAPWSALSVHYQEDSGAFVDFKIYPETPDLVLLNPQVVINSPVEYLVAGVGDTLAKYYESEVIFENLKPSENNTQLRISQTMAQACKDNLLQNTEQAIADMEAGQVTPVFQQVAETIIVTAGLVGGWGDYYARSTGAHAMDEALNSFEQPRSALHGERVAYGILVQVALEERLDEFKELLSFYRRIGLREKLADFGLDPSDDQVIEKLAQVTAVEGGEIHFLPLDTSAQAVAKAIRQVEELTK